MEYRSQFDKTAPVHTTLRVRKWLAVMRSASSTLPKTRSLNLIAVSHPSKVVYLSSPRFTHPHPVKLND